MQAVVDTVADKGIFHKNKAARDKSRLSTFFVGVFLKRISIWERLAASKPRTLAGCCLWQNS
jgi:hypothetical protein